MTSRTVVTSTPPGPGSAGRRLYSPTSSAPLMMQRNYYWASGPALLSRQADGHARHRGRRPSTQPGKDSRDQAWPIPNPLTLTVATSWTGVSERIATAPDLSSTVMMAQRLLDVGEGEGEGEGKGEGE
jgi:hypothetical protein